MRIIKKLKLLHWELLHPISRSSHMKDYEEIATKYSITARRVYLLAHGMHAESRMDERVLRDLMYRGIIAS